LACFQTSGFILIDVATIVQVFLRIVGVLTSF
jgi:hypothetical protein